MKKTTLSLFAVMLLFGLYPALLNAQDAAEEAPTVTNGLIAFTSGRYGNKEIYVMDADGDNSQRLTNHEASDTNPTWQPVPITAP